MTDFLWLHQARARTAWYELTHDERAEREQQWNAIRDREIANGSRWLGRFNVRGQSDHNTTDVWVFDGPGAAFAYWDTLVAAGRAQWFACANSGGLREETDA